MVAPPVLFGVPSVSKEWLRTLIALCGERQINRELRGDILLLNGLPTGHSGITLPI